MCAREKPAVEDSPAGTPERILRAATHLFATKGYEGTSTKEICEAAGVNIAAIHYHFESKEALLRHILESFGSLSLKAVQRILEGPESEDAFRLRLRMYLEEVIDSYLEQPEVWKIIQIECEMMNDRTEEVFRKTFIKRYEVLVTFLTQAREKGFVSAVVEPDFAARALLSQIFHHTRFDHVLKRYHGISLRDPAFRSRWVQQTLLILLDGVGSPNL